MSAVVHGTPAALVDQVGGAVVAAGGWVLASGAVSSQCAEIDLEFPRPSCLEVYGCLLMLGLEMTAASHRELERFWHCTHTLQAGLEAPAARMHLCLYAEKGSQAFLGAAWRGELRAA